MTRKLQRRNFLGQVMGLGVAIGSLGLIQGSAEARTRRRRRPQRQMVVDADASDPARLPSTPPPVPARSGEPTDIAQRPEAPARGCTDSDSGPAADLVGHGRHCGYRRPRTTDSDPTDHGPTADNDHTDSGAHSGPRERFILCPGNARCPR